jgi:hypothetical protein
MLDQPDYSKSMSEPVRRALHVHQDAVDQALAIASLLLARFDDAIQGGDAPEATEVVPALQVIVDRLQSVSALEDAVQLTRSGAAIMGGDHA